MQGEFVRDAVYFSQAVCLFRKHGWVDRLHICSFQSPWTAAELDSAASTPLLTNCSLKKSHQYFTVIKTGKKQKNKNKEQEALEVPTSLCSDGA